MGLRCVEVIEHLGLRVIRPETSSMAPRPVTGTTASSSPPVGTDAGTAEWHPQGDRSLAANRSSTADQTWHPSTENGRPLNEREWLVPSSRELRRSRGATSRDTREFVSMLPLNEALVVKEAEALVEAGEAEWVEPGSPA